MIILLPSPFRKLLRGEQPLARAFWFYGFFLYCVLWFACDLALQPLLSRNLTDLAIGLRAVIIWPYAILIWVGIWRSANAYSGKEHWAIAAKIAVCFCAVTMVVGFFRNGGFNRLFGLLMGSD